MNGLCVVFATNKLIHSFVETESARRQQARKNWLLKPSQEGLCFSTLPKQPLVRVNENVPVPRSRDALGHFGLVRKVTGTDGWQAQVNLWTKPILSRLP